MSVYEKAVFNYIVCHVAKMRVSGNNANWEWCIGARGIHNQGILRKKNSFQRIFPQKLGNATHRCSLYGKMPNQSFKNLTKVKNVHLS